MQKSLYASLLLLALASCGSKQETSRQPMAVDVAEVEVDSVTLRKSYPGFLRANSAIDVVARVNGTLLTKNYTSGDMIRKGQVLFTIESTQYADAVRQAKAQLETAISELQYAESHYAAVKKASEMDAVSRMEVLQAESNYNTSKAAVDNARAALRTAQTTLGYCTIYAPSSGRITGSSVDVGGYVGGNDMKLATIYDDSSLNAVFSIDDPEHLSKLTDPASGLDMSNIPLTFEEPLSKNYFGALSYIAPGINASTGTLELKAKVTNPNGELRDGMYVNVQLPYGFNPKGILVKDASISTDQLGKFVYLVNDSNKVVYTPIKTGQLVNDTMRLVTDGLHPGDRYVTKALLKVRNDMTVKPVTVK